MNSPSTTVCSSTFSAVNCGASPWKMCRASLSRFDIAASFTLLRLNALFEIGSTSFWARRSLSSNRISSAVRSRLFSSPTAQTMSSWASSGT